MAEFVEDLHPRVERGQPGGGRFAPKGGGTGGYLLDEQDHAEIDGYTVGKPVDWEPAYSKLTPNEREAIDEYQGTAFVDINTHFRRGDELSPATQKIVAVLDKLTNSATLDRDMLLHRFIGVNSILEQQLPKLKPGDKLVDPGFLSTTLRTDKPVVGGGQRPNLHMVILAQKRTRGVYLGTHEEEVLLPRGSRLEYMGEDERGDKYFKLDQTKIEHVKPEEALTDNSVGAVKKQLVPEFVKLAQEEYDAWTQDAEGIDPELGSGGICDRVANQIGNVLASAGIEQVTAGDPGDHAWIVANLKEGVYTIDIPPSVYETGGGYNWKKRQGVTITADDVAIDKIDKPMSDEEFNRIYGERT